MVKRLLAPLTLILSAGVPAVAQATNVEPPGRTRIWIDRYEAYEEYLRALDEATLEERLRPWLFGKRSVKELLERRDTIVEKLERLAAERGETAVFTP